jgi:hypothetical protein
MIGQTSTNRFPKTYHDRETPIMHAIPRRTFEEADALADLRHPDSWSPITSHRLSC